MISILCPSRGRPELANRMLNSAIQTASEEIEILFYLNDDDLEIETYKKLIPSKYYKIGTDQSPAYSWNRLAEECKGDIMFLMGDDAHFETLGWDIKIKSAFDQFPDKIACVYPHVPGIKKINNPHFCVHKNWIKTLGYFVPPHFWHWYVDTWTRDLAIKINRYIRLDDFPLPIILDPDDDTVARKDRLNLRERDHWLWKVTERHRDADVLALKKFIENFKNM